MNDLLKLFLSLQPDEEIVITCPALSPKRIKFLVVAHTPEGKVGCSAHVSQIEIQASVDSEFAARIAATALFAVRQKTM